MNLSSYKQLLEETINETIMFCKEFFNSAEGKTLLITQDENNVTKIFEEYLSMTFTNIISKKNNLENSISEIRLKWANEYEHFPFYLSSSYDWANIEIDSISEYNDKYILTEIKLKNKFYYGEHKSDIGRLCYLLKKSKDISWCNFIIFDIKNINDLNNWSGNINIIEKEITDFINIDDNTDNQRMKTTIKNINDATIIEENSKVKVIIIKKDLEEKNVLMSKKIEMKLEEDIFYGNIYEICFKNIQTSIYNLKNLIYSNKKDFLNLNLIELKEIRVDLSEMIKTSSNIFAPNVLKSKVLITLFNSHLKFDIKKESYNEIYYDYNDNKNIYEDNARNIFKIIDENKIVGLSKMTVRRADIIVLLINKFFLDLELTTEQNILFKELEKLLNFEQNKEISVDKRMEKLAFLAIYYLKKINKIDENGILSVVKKWDDSVDEEINTVYINFISYLYIKNFDFEIKKTKNAKFPDLDRDMKKCMGFINDLHNKVTYFKKNNIKIFTSEDKVPNYIFYYKITNVEDFIYKSKDIDRNISKIRENLKIQIVEFNPGKTMEILKEIEELFINETIK